MYQLFAFDVDGTLVNSDKEVTPKTQVALEKLHDLGHKVVISSGRPFHGVELIADKVGADLIDYVSCFNGGLVKDLHSGQVVTQSQLSLEEVKVLARQAQEGGVDIHFYNDTQLLTPQAPQHDYMTIEEKLVDMPITVIDLDDLTDGTTKVMFTGPPKLLDQVQAQLPADYPDRFSIVKSEPYFLEFNPKGIDKGSSLAILADQLGLDKSEVMTFGDQNNDQSMIEWAGMGVAMGNAIPELKEVSDYVTNSNDDEGIAQALESLVFKNQD